MKQKGNLALTLSITRVMLFRNVTAPNQHTTKIPRMGAD